MYSTKDIQNLSDKKKEAAHTYIDKYCFKHEISIEEALTHSIIQDYLDYMINKTEIVNKTNTKINAGCGGTDNGNI